MIESWFAEMPGLNVAVPATPADTKGLIKTALHLDDPVLFLMHKALTGVRGEVGGPDDFIPFGMASIVREGQDATLIGYGATVRTCVTGRRASGRRGRLRGGDRPAHALPARPRDGLASLRKTGRAVIVDKSAGFGGVSAEIAASLQGLPSTTWTVPSGGCTRRIRRYRRAGSCSRPCCPAAARLKPRCGR